MSEKLLGIIIIGVIGSLLTLARRYKNSDGDAGYGVAGWTIIIILIWIFYWNGR